MLTSISLGARDEVFQENHDQNLGTSDYSVHPRHLGMSTVILGIMWVVPILRSGGSVEELPLHAPNYCQSH